MYRAYLYLTALCCVVTACAGNAVSNAGYNLDQNTIPDTMPAIPNFPILNRNPNSGLVFSLGVGYLAHKVRVEHQNNRIYALDGAYEKGYDRKTTGLALSQHITYRHHSDNKLANFSIGLAAYQAFTKNRRLYNFDLGGPDNRSRVDLSFGVTIGWIIPMYTRMASEYFYD